jgi:probable F420-dependent oxidoreductase
MKLALSIPHHGRLAGPEFVRDFCMAADELGFGALWAVDHVVMPERINSEYTLARRPAVMKDNSVSHLLAPNYESTSTLLFAAGITSRIALGTSVSVLPLRNPVLNARMLATLDVYSGGRLIFGVGVGWLREEAEAMQMPWDHRGARSEEHIALLRHLWLADGALTSFEGRFYRFPNIDPEPRPIQRPPPILIGGHSDVAIDRAARIGDGWIAASMSLGRLEEHLTKLRAAADKAGRNMDAMTVVNGMGVAAGTGTDQPMGEPMADVVARAQAFRAAGVDYLSLGIDAPDRATLMAIVRQLAEDLIPAVA